jgi:hypothetical protein
MKESIKQLKQKMVEEFDRRYDFSENKTLEYSNLLTIRDFFLSKLSELEQATREEIINDFIEGRRCLSCGELKGEGGELTDSCLKCLEEN